MLRTKMCNTFTSFSYYETSNIFGKLFGAAYPSLCTTPPNLSFIKEQIGKPLFGNLFEEHHLKQYINFLNYKTFGFHDNIGYLIPKLYQSETYNASTVCDHLNDLRLLTITEETEHDIVIEAGSTVFSETISLRLHNESLPQKAIDTSVYYVDEESKKIMTTLGYKKKSTPVKIVFSDGTILECLKFGMFGYLYGAGEHVEPKTEGEKINSLIATNYSSVLGNGFVLYKDAEIVNRGLLEEVGITVDPSAKSKYYLYGIHDKLGRDPRYYEHKYNDIIFGYPRKSESVLIAVIIKGKVPTELPDPTDVEEVGKAQLVSLDEMADGFVIGGKFNPAFPAHVEQFGILLSKLFRMILE